MRLTSKTLGLLALGAIFVIGLSGQQPSEQAPAAQESAVTQSQDLQLRPGAPVTVNGKHLFTIRESIGAYSAQRRAEDITSRLREIAESFDESVPELRTEVRADATIILAGDQQIMAVTDADARAVERERAAYVQVLVDLLSKSLAEEKKEFSFRALVQGFILAALATAALYFLFVFSRKGLSKVVWWLYELKDKRIRSIRFQKTVLLSSRRLTRLLILAARLLWLLLLLFALYVYLPIVFRFFPYTREISDQIIAYTLTPVRVLWGMFVAQIPNLFFILVIVVITYYATRLARFLFREIEAERIVFPGFYQDWAMPTYKIVRVLLITFALVIAYPYIPGSSSDAFKGISIFFGLLFSLGSTGIVANVVSGVILTYTRAFVIGDRVKIGETTGDVIEKTLLVTRLRTIKNVDVSIPNSVLLSSQIVNYSAVSKEKGLILHTTVTIGYDVPWRKVHELLTQAALETVEVLENPKPYVLQTSLDDFYVSYELNAYTNASMRMASTYSQLHANIQDKFNEAGVEIMSPHYRAARDGNLVTIPANYLDKDYRTPKFQVEFAPATPSAPQDNTEELIVPEEKRRAPNEPDPDREPDSDANSREFRN